MTAEVITYRGRSAVRDVGKAMGLSLDMVDTMAGKLDWWHRGRARPSDRSASAASIPPTAPSVRSSPSPPSCSAFRAISASTSAAW